MPGWLVILLQVLNLIGSSGMVGLATYSQTAGMPGAKEGAIVSGIGAAVQQLRDNPLSGKKIEEKKNA